GTYRDDNGALQRQSQLCPRLLPADRSESFSIYTIRNEEDFFSLRPKRYHFFFERRGNGNQCASTRERPADHGSNQPERRVDVDVGPARRDTNGHSQRFPEQDRCESVRIDKMRI